MIGKRANAVRSLQSKFSEELISKRIIGEIRKEEIPNRRESTPL